MFDPPRSSDTDSQIGVSSSHKPLQAANTVAAGSSPRFIQLPSPVYVVSWISTTHVLIAAGGGGSRFGMANVLILLSIHLSNDSDPSLGIENGAACLGLSVKLDAEQHKMVAKAAPPSSGSVSGSLEAGVRVPHLWRFLGALDLGGDVPWCASKYLPLERLEVSCGMASDAIPVSTREWTLEACKSLQYAHGIIALSSIRTFSLIAVEHVPQNNQADKSIQPSESSCSATYRLTLLARVDLPTEVDNEDKKPIAMVRYAVVVAHDACGIHAYDLRSLVPLGEREGEDGAVTPVTQATPMAKWTLPDRVNDLHADRFSWVSVKTSLSQPTEEPHLQGISPRPSYKALSLDYVLVAALVRDKTLRLGSFLQCGPHAPLRRLCRGQEQLDGIEWESEEEEQSESSLAVIETIREEAVLSGVDCGLQFNLLPSSMRLVRLFGLETLSSSAQDTALRMVALRITQHTVESLMPLPLVSLLMVVYDQHRNQSFFLHAHVMVSTCSRTLSSEKEISAKCTNKCGEGGRRGRRGCHPFHCQIRIGAGGLSPIIKDAITCISPCYAMDVCPDIAPKQSQLNFQSAVGASLPTHWLAGTVEGWIVLVVRNSRIQPDELDVKSLANTDLTAKADVADGRRGNYSVSEHGGASEPFFVLRYARPSFLLGRGGRPRKVGGGGRGNDPCWENPDVPLHSEPVTAVAVSKLNDVLSTDIAQNVVLSTLPISIRTSGTTILPNHSESMDLLPKVEGLELFPKAVSFRVKIVRALSATNVLLMRLRWILLILTILWGVFILFY